MMTTLRSIVPLILFLLFLSVVGYLLWDEWTEDVVVLDDPPTQTPTSSPSYTLTPTMALTPSPAPNPSITDPPTLTPVSTLTPPPIDTPMLTSTPTAVPASKSISASSSSPAPTETYTPTPIPPLIYGQVQVANLHVRWGPGEEYGFVGAVYGGDQVTVLGRNQDGFWLQVETRDGKVGWLVTRFIDLPDDVSTLPEVPVPPPPPSPSELTPIILPGGIRTLTLRADSIFDELEAGAEEEFIFRENQIETVIILMFEPNINSGNMGYVQFVLYSRDTAGNIEIVGGGSRPGDDRDGYLSTGELIWRGGPLIFGKEYYLRLINNGSEPVQYCLATIDAYHWSC